MTSSTLREPEPNDHEGTAGPLGLPAAVEPFAAARARLPLECVRQLEPGAPARHELAVEAGDALARLAEQLAVPPLTALAAAWVAYVGRVRSSDAAADVELLEPSAGDAPARRSLSTLFDDSQPFAKLARAIASGEHGPGREAAAFVVTQAPSAERASLARVELGASGEVRLSLDASRFFEATAAELAEGFGTLLQSAARGPDTPIADLELLSSRARSQLVLEVNATEAPFEPRCFHELFEEQARRTPEALALRFHDRALSYRELNAKANQIAHYLKKRGGERRPIAMLFERSAEMIVALLGIMKAGGAYVPLLPDVPPARLAHQLSETGAPVVLTQSKLESAVPAGSLARVVCLDRDAAALEREPTSDPERCARPDDLAYVIYTSGSTGNPKGVAVRHDNLVNYTRFLAKKLGLELPPRPGQVPLACATVSTLAADLGNTSIFPCLATGGCLHVIDHAMSLDGNAFAAYARKYPIDVLKITPSHLAALLAYEGCEDVLPRRFLVTGGEGSTWPLREKVRARPGLVWFNHYGPTETTIGSLTYDLDEVDRHFTAIIPIGRPIANTRVYVLDERRRLLPRGVVGELYIGGRGVTAGYMNQPELTAERFLDDPFAGKPGARMYRTGDRVRLLPSGAIEFLGRVDHQVKIRGYRIELGEIEATLRRHPEVRQTIVVAREDRPGDLRIVAYVVPASAPGPSAASLADALAAELPPFMIPSAFVRLEALPLNANGKVDRKALPPPEEPAIEAGEEPDAPPPSLGALEQQVVDIWREVLGKQRIAPTDDFFRIGGDSLKALYVLAKIERQLGKRLTHGELIMAPTVKGLVAALSREGPRREFASLVPLQPHGSKPPLFCFHGGGGHVYYYRDLARRLGSDQPFYGLQGRHADGRLSRQTRVEDMAEFYLEEMKEVAPNGPYYLAGASFGGKVAFEVAQQLLRRGEQAALVAMFDTWGPGYPEYQVGPTLQAAGWLYRRVEHHLGSVLMLEHEQRWPYLKEKARKTRDEARDVLNLKLARMKQRKVPGVAKIAPDVDEGFIAIASKAYKPSFYPGKVHLFRSKQQPIGVKYDRALGWAGLAAELEIHDVVGLHAAVVAEPRVRFLVEKLTPCLEEARARFGG